MALNALQKALVDSGLAEQPKERRRRPKQFKCNKCETVMVQPENMNLMYCPNCDVSFFIFDR